MTQAELDALNRVVGLLKLVKLCHDAIMDGAGRNYATLALRTLRMAMKVWTSGKQMRDDIQIIEEIIKRGKTLEKV